MLPSFRPRGVNRQGTIKSQRLLTGIIYTAAFFLTSGWSIKGPQPLLTNRDKELREILLLSVDSSTHPFLSERNAQLNNLRRQYFEKFSQPDWAAEMSVVNTNGVSSSKQPFFGLQSNFRSVFQFSGNWDLNSGWSLFGFQKGNVPTQVIANSDLPTLEHLELNYGKMRSVEMSLGLPEEVAILHDSKIKSIFSGLSLKLHPLEQKLSPTAPHYSFSFEHGWANLLSPIESGPGRTKVQRTRPQLIFEWKPGHTNFALSSGLEWYSDSSGALGRILGQRPNALAEVQNSPERQWRLFHVSAQAHYQTNNETSLTLGFQRVSNTLGASSSPAWSLSSGAEGFFSFANFIVTPSLNVTLFQIPSGSVPPFRLPLEFTPGSDGALAQLSLAINHPTLRANAFKLGAHYLSERRTEDTGRLHCSLWGQNATQSCAFGWISLAWSLKLPTNL